MGVLARTAPSHGYLLQQGQVGSGVPPQPLWTSGTTDPLHPTQEPEAR